MKVLTLNCAQLSALPKDKARLEKIAGALAMSDGDLVHLSELESFAAYSKLLVHVNENATNRGSDLYAGYFHDTRSRNAGPSLALLIRSNFANASSLVQLRFDQDPKFEVTMGDPARNGAPFALRLRRGYIIHFKCCQTRRTTVVCGLHLQSLRGNQFSHYKRMAQARIGEMQRVTK